MSIPGHVEEEFLAGLRTEATTFVINDSVRVKAGRHAGRSGAVIAIVTLEPEATYLVEPDAPPWGDIVVEQSGLELISG